MKNIIIFDYQLDGHNIEYLHHLYIGAIKDASNRYIFSLPEEFEKLKDVMSWPEASNIVFDMYRLSEVRSRRPIVTSYKSSVYLRKIVARYHADEVILLWMMAVLPFVAWFMPKGVKVSGIVYNIYLYLWKEYGFIAKLANVLKYWFLANYNCIDKVYILNDRSAVSCLTRIWKTNKFVYLPDPYVPFMDSQIEDLRGKLGIPNDKIICLHMGAMSFKKGTLTVLDLIERSSSLDLKPYTFVFAGKIYPDIKERFYSRVEKLRDKVQIVIKDDFLPYESLGSMVYTCDKVVLPYTRIDASSGSIAYASQFNKTVYAPNKGLLGKLVKRYGIGVTLNEFNNIHSLELSNNRMNTYCQTHGVGDFNKVILGI